MFSTNTNFLLFYHSKRVGLWFLQRNIPNISLWNFMPRVSVSPLHLVFKKVLMSIVLLFKWSRCWYFTEKHTHSSFVIKQTEILNFVPSNSFWLIFMYLLFFCSNQGGLDNFQRNLPILSLWKRKPTPFVLLLPSALRSVVVS